MTQFDALIRRGLMDANLKQYTRAIQKTEAPPDFSPRYLRERTRLLADPRGWMRRGGKRLDWRLAVLIAALLLLSACAYAVFMGQFSQWFPGLETDLQMPEASEDVMERMGTVIGQSQTADGVALTLNAAVWDGNSVRLSFTAEGNHFPAELTEDSWLYTEECRMEMPDSQWNQYARRYVESCHAGSDLPAGRLEEYVQDVLDKGQAGYWSVPAFTLTGREENRLTFEMEIRLNAYLERPELTLYLEHIAIYGEPMDENAPPGPGTPVLDGPFAFTFSLEEPVLPLTYTGSVPMTYEDLPLRVKKINISVFSLYVYYDILKPVQFLNPGDIPDPDKLNISMENPGPEIRLLGFWLEDGRYIDCSESSVVSAISTTADGKGEGSAGYDCPLVMDPAAVTAVNFSGTRIPLDSMALQTDPEIFREFSF